MELNTSAPIKLAQIARGDQNADLAGRDPQIEIRNGSANASDKRVEGVEERSAAHHDPWLAVPARERNVLHACHEARAGASEIVVHGLLQSAVPTDPGSSSDAFQAS